MRKYRPYSEYKPNSECIVCSASFYCPPSMKDKGGGKFCTKKCMGLFKKGKKDPNLTYKFPKGNIPWNTGAGKWHTVQCKNCTSYFETLKSKNQVFCSKTCSDAMKRVVDRSKMTYGTIHAHIRRDFGTPNICEHCKTTESKKFEWANISGEYKLERSDWARLCCKCHRRYDRGTKNKIAQLCV